jgi:hypothetical protein
LRNDRVLEPDLAGLPGAIGRAGVDRNRPLRAGAAEQRRGQACTERGIAIELRFQIFELEREVQHVGVRDRTGRNGGRGGRGHDDDIVAVVTAGAQHRQAADRTRPGGHAHETATIGPALGGSLFDDVENEAFFAHD